MDTKNYQVINQYCNVSCKAIDKACQNRILCQIVAEDERKAV